jgi:hypothetical protein
VLVELGQPSDDSYILVTISHGDQLQVALRSSSINQQAVLTTGTALNDDQWYGLTLHFTAAKQLVATLLHPDCLARCNASMTSFNLSVGVIAFGQGTVTQPGFVGCMQDIRVKSVSLSPDWLTVHANVSGNVEPRCSRVDQCAPATCNHHGRCDDLWNSFSCSCDRPFYGRTCTEGRVLLLML